MKPLVVRIVVPAVLSMVACAFWACSTLLRFTDRDCDRTSGKILASPDGKNFAQLKVEVCTGLARGSSFGVYLGGSDRKDHEIFTQEGPAAPIFYWKNSKILAIEVQSSEHVYVSLHNIENLNIEYYIPLSLSRQAFIAEMEDYKKRMRPLIEQGKVDASGGSVQQDLRNLDENIQHQLSEYNNFIDWMSINDVQINQTKEGR